MFKYAFYNKYIENVVNESFTAKISESNSS